MMTKGLLYQQTDHQSQAVVTSSPFSTLKWDELFPLFVYEKSCGFGILLTSQD
jgi:hypothetical protein